MASKGTSIISAITLDVWMSAGKCKLASLVAQVDFVSYKIKGMTNAVSCEQASHYEI